MLDKSAIQKIADMANAANELPSLLTPIKALEKEVKIVSLEYYLPGRVRYRGIFTTMLIADLAKYSSQFPGGKTFVDQPSMTASIFLNLGDHHLAGHADHVGKLALKKTAPYIALLDAVNTTKHSQKDLAEWLQDWRDFLVAFDADGNSIDIKSAIAAVRKITIAQTSEITTAEEDFSGSRSAMEEIEARSALKLPSGFRFTTIPYHGLDSRSFEIRMSINTDYEKPFMKLRHVRFEESEELMAQEFADKLSTALKSAGADADIFIGTFAP